MSFIPLHVHSQYSILDATISIPKLIEKACEYKLSACALTDQGNLYGAVDFYKACKSVRIKAIIGCELYVAPVSRFEKKKLGNQKPGYPIVLLAKDKKGYQNLCKLSSYAHLEGFYYTPRIDKELLQAHFEGLVCLSGPMRGKIAELILEEKEEELQSEISFYHGLFKEDFYLELNRHYMSEKEMRADGMDRESWLWQAALEYQKKQEKVFDRITTFSKQWGISCVATSDARYLYREDWQAHEILMNISSGEPCEIWERDSSGNPKVRIPNPKRKVCLSHALDFKSPEEMHALFSDVPEALEETLLIADKCNFSFDLTSKFYPVFIPPELEGKTFTSKEREEAAEAFLRRICQENVHRCYSPKVLEKVAEKHPGKDPFTIVQERLNYELELVTSKGLGDYLLIVYDFISWAKSQGIPVGPGRGSGVGSIICYLSGITDIEPLQFSLFFERFINPERVSYPDIDVDICMERREEVIDYTVRKYGKDKVAQIITFGTMKAKMAIKDVGRVLSIPLAKVNEIAKLIPEDVNMTLDRAFELDQELRSLYEKEEETKRLIDLAKILEGSVRNTGIHAAGLIISADSLMQHIPVCAAKDSEFLVTQFAMKPVEAVGMLKIDFLGLKTLTAIQLAVKAIEKSEKNSLDWVNLPLDDKPTFHLLNQGKTLGIFQIESGGMQELAKQLHIDKFEEILAVVALYRPGPIEMIPSFINRKHGREKIEFDHPKMKDILEETYGIMVYQEQVMMMAQRLAGYSLGEGDVLRKAMGKKDKEEMTRQREKFRKGALKEGIDESTAMHIFDKVEKFASYGFNRSHAAAYGYLSYVTAYLKAHFPKHWMAALMTTDRDDLSKITKIIRECNAMEIAILPPDINESGKEFVAALKGIRFAMTAIKGVGEGVVKAILEERETNGSYQSFYDFLRRIDKNKVGKKVIEYLIEAGSFDFTCWKRAQLLASVEPIYQVVQKEQKEQQKGQSTFFSLIEDENKRFDEPPQDCPEMSKMEVLKKEKELLGFYLTGHPLDGYESLLLRLSCMSLLQISQLESDTICRTAFVIESVAIKFNARSGRKFAVLTIGDTASRFELPIWSDLFEEKERLLKENQCIYAVVQTERKKDGDFRLQCRWLDDLTSVSEEMMQSCDLAFDKARMQMRMSQLQERKKNMPREKAKQENSFREKNMLIIKLHAAKTRLSHILQLKQIFRDAPGKTEIRLEFWSKEKLLGEIFIDSAWGVNASREFLESLSAIPAVFSERVDNLLGKD